MGRDYLKRRVEKALKIARLIYASQLRSVTSEGRTIWIVDAHGYGKRFIVRADEKLTAFLELESAILACCDLS